MKGDNWQVIIGLEVHAQLTTRSKIFSETSTSFGSEPNSQASLIDLGFPGTLPVINESVIRKAIIFGVAVNGTIAKESVFSRKNYFYPDLPKGYQISQYDEPIVTKGILRIDPNDQNSSVLIERAHLEEDAGKSIHFSKRGYSGIDLNRAGTPLLEIVTAPVIQSSGDAIRFLKRLRELVMHLGICDGNMQEGSFRCDANVSVRPRESQKLGIRAEIKNLNSFKFIESAIEYERSRQIHILESGDNVMQETRLYDEKNQETRPMRSKENEFDYRYFPDPDLLPLEVDQALIERISKSIPELPDSKRIRYKQDYNFSDEDINILLSDPAITKYFEATLTAKLTNTKSSFNWITGELFRLLKKNKLKISESKIKATELGFLLEKIEQGEVTKNRGKDILNRMWEEGKAAKEIIAQEILENRVPDSNLKIWIKEVFLENKKQVTEYCLGKEKVFGFLVGQVMKKSQGKGDPRTISEEISKKLKAAMKEH